ncbi:MAG: aminoacyl-tRNA hydrolase [Nitrospirales bacterium]|nr:aminoacyl-tRNA hydrolase [Nitrospirales bacterium]
MRLIVGLGNPGRPYASTRHNVGVMALERAAVRWNILLREMGSARRGQGILDHLNVTLAQPLAWMNQNGPVVEGLVTELGLTSPDLIVIHDDVDLPVGRLRIKRLGGSGGHNGIRSVQTALASQEFCRIKIGVGRPAPGEETADYVLSPFRKEEREVVDRALDHVVMALESCLSEGIETAMNRFNVRDAEGAE